MVGLERPVEDTDLYSNRGKPRSSITHDTYIDRHAEMVARYHEGSLG
jgi:hypothetical protein